MSPLNRNTSTQQKTNVSVEVCSKRTVYPRRFYCVSCNCITNGLKISFGLPRILWLTWNMAEKLPFAWKSPPLSTQRKELKWEERSVHRRALFTAAILTFHSSLHTCVFFIFNPNIRALINNTCIYPAITCENGLLLKGPISTLFHYQLINN